jgi:hypothetical protein
MAALSSDNSAYAQQESIEVEDGRVSIEGGRQQESIEVEDGRVSIEGGRQQRSVDDDRGEDTQPPSPPPPPPPPQQGQPDSGTSDIPIKEEEEEDGGTGEDTQPPSPPPSPPPPQEQQPPLQQEQPDSSTSLMPTEDGTSEDNNSSEQPTGPIKFAFVDSFWTDYTSLGGVVASTSSESITAQALPPVIKQEVEPGEGEAVLAVVLRNVGFADATSISGSLDLPSGFRALVTPEDVDSDTVLSSYNGIVNAGQTFTLYFRIEITEESQVGREYTGELKLRYFNVAEQEDEDTRSTTLDIPFRLSGKVILSTSAVMTTSSSASPQELGSGLSNIVTANAGVVNPLKIEISNNGSAIATGVIVDVLPSNTVSSSTVQTGADVSGTSTNDNTSAESTTSETVTQQSVSSSSPSPPTMVVVGSPTFNLGIIDANAKKEILPTIFPADTAAGTLTTLTVQISYNDAYGNKKILNRVLGVQISPESPQSGLNVAPSSLTSSDITPESSQATLTRTSVAAPSNNSTTSQDELASSSSSNNNNISNRNSSSSPQTRSIQIAAGSVEDLSFAITNTNDPGVTIEDVVVSLTSESDAVRILGNSRWNLQSIAAGSQEELSTRVYASTSMIGSPVFFTVTMQYIRNGNELKTESFQLGAIIVGNVQISVNDITISYIGDTPNLVGNLLNEGNSPALFTTIELVESGTQGGLELLRPTISSQFLGDLAVNSPLPFNIPLQITQQNSGQEEEVTLNGYPISLRITYSDELRNTHEFIVDETINLEPIQARTDQRVGTSLQQNALLNNGFIDAYWVDSSQATSSSTSSGNLSSATSTTTSTLPPEREVGPGEGPSFLAVVLSNTAFSDITGIIGYLSLPEGFAATTTTTSSANTTNGATSPEETSSQTAVASLSNIVRAGQTYTLYFKVNVLETAQKGFHEALLRINYFKVPEPQPGTYRVQTITIPFELPGRVILDASSETDDLVPGEANDITLRISNSGSADAHSVIVNINAIGGSIISNDDEEATQSTGSNNASNGEIGADRQTAQQQQQLPSSSAAVASVGARTFNIGSIPANGSAEIATTIYPSSSAGGTLQNLDIEILYNDANGIRRSVPLSLGFRVQPNPPEGGLSVAPSSLDIKGQYRIILASTITGSPAGNDESNNDSSGNGSSEVTIIAGRPHDLNFNITNNNRNPITDIVVTLVPRSESLEILGDSRWTVQELAAQSKARFSTRVFASESLIGSPVSFEVGVQYISGDQIKSDSFSLGGNVIGEIEITVNDLSVRNIGDVPNLTGNLLNQGNTQAFFTTIEMLSNSTSQDQRNLVPLTNTPQYLGDLDDNSPLPFSIPLAISSTNDENGSSGSLGTGNYPVSLRITYSDELRNTHELVLDGTVSYSPPQREEDAPNQGFLGFGSSSNTQSGRANSIVPLLAIFAVIVAAAVVAIIIIKRRRSRSKKISKLIAEQDDNYDFDTSSTEGPQGSSSEDKSSSHKP